MHKQKLYWKNYLWQTLLATLAMSLVLTILSQRRAIVVTSMAATAFIVFMRPHSPFAAPRNVIGGHLIGLLSGSIFALVPQSSPAIGILLSALAVGCSMLAMALLNAEHPPAAGTTLSIVAAGFTWQIALTVMASATLMSLLHHLLRPYLRDL